MSLGRGGGAQGRQRHGAPLGRGCCELEHGTVEVLGRLAQVLERLKPVGRLAEAATSGYVPFEPFELTFPETALPVIASENAWSSLVGMAESLIGS